MTVKGGSSPACAACKYQRRKCTPECILAPYFPASQPKAFQNAHRLFGVSNIMKILKQLTTLEEKEEAMLSIKYESDARERDPVHGCTGIIIDLRKQIRQTIYELHCVYSHMAFCKEQAMNNSQMDQSQLQLGFQHQSAGTSSQFGIECPIGYEPESANVLAFEHLPEHCYPTGEAYYDMMRAHNPVLNQVVDDDAHQLQDFANPEIRPPLSNYENMDLNANVEINAMVEENMEVNAMVDDRQSFVETREASESSSRSTLQDYPNLVERVSESDLRNAAACLSLTSINKGGVEIF